MTQTRFEWDTGKDAENQKKHGIPFTLAQHAFADPHRVIAEDLAHSVTEKRYFVLVRSTVDFSPSGSPTATESSGFLAPVTGAKER